MKAFLRTAADVAIVVLPVVLRDGLGLAGIGLVVYGVALVHVPAAFVTAGVLLLGAAIGLGRRAR